MSLRRNIAANYLSQIYVAVVGLAVTPLYLQYLGSEAYGLVGFFGTLFAWFQLLDVGLSPVVMREVARHRAGVMSDADLWLKVRAIEGIFVVIGVAASAALLLSAEAVSTKWLSALTLDPAEVVQALQLMAVCIGLRFASVLYRGVVAGLEQFDWLAGFNAIMATLRAFSVVPAMTVWGGSPTVFFATQLLIGVIEIGTLLWRAYSQLPSARQVHWRPGPLREIWRFSLAVAFTGGIGVAVTQSDRLILSGLLDLRSYGHFSLAVLAASVILLVGAPLGSALQPRMATQFASGDQAAALTLFRQSSRLLAVLTIPAAVLLAGFGETILLTWTGSSSTAQEGGMTLALYAMGNVISAQLVLPYSLQFAAGRLRLHVLGNGLLILLLIPGQVILTMRYGAIGAGACWLIMNLAYATLWIPIALRPLAPQVLRPWYLNFAKMLTLAAAIAWLARPGIAMLQHFGRIPSLLGLLGLGLMLTAVLAASDDGIRRQLRERIAGVLGLKGSTG